MRWSPGRPGTGRTARAAGADRADVPYEPSDFARRYGALKEASGWYDPGTVTSPMFEGEAYELYEEMMGPYATRLARDLSGSGLAPTLVPYASGDIRIHGDVASSQDPVWAHARGLSSVERDALLRMDGSRSLAQITAKLSLPIQVLTAVIDPLYLDGFILFDRACSGILR